MKSKPPFRNKKPNPRDIAMMDEVVRDLFRRGGPQRPSSPPKRISFKETPPPAKGSTPCLEKEQRRLIKEWKRKE